MARLPAMSHILARAIAHALVACALCAPLAAAPASAGVLGKPKAVQLFGTMEFKGKLTALPLWLEVLGRLDQNPTLMPSPSLSAARQAKAEKLWKTLKAKAAKLSPMDTLKEINSFFNKWPYRLDTENWGRADYWAAPGEFIARSGDCEDYSIIKYYALKELGFTPMNLRIVALKDSIRGIGHAVLAVYLEDDAYILDNVTNLVLPHERYTHYVPHYSVNELFRWAHIPVKKGGK
ncbi:MAG: transglutaminase-like cysteine peptidase [Desulfovibrionaceae bacterium]